MIPLDYRYNQGVMAHSGLCLEHIRIPRGTFSGRQGEEFVFIAQHKKEPKSLLPDTFSGLKMYPKYICSRAVPQVAHSASPRPIAGFRGRFVGRKGGKGESEGEEVRSRESRGAEGRGASGTEGREGEEGDEKGRGLA